LPYLNPVRYKGLKGGRGSGKSHFYAELLVEKMMLEPNESAVCIREIQKSLNFSAKKLLEDKIDSYNLYEYFEITQTQIRNKKGKGLIIFQGIQDHTADSIKSLEVF
jgi:phage terminase large subunit